MKLSFIEIIVLLIGLIVVAPILVALLTPTPDAITMGLLWLLTAAVFVAGFFLVRRLIR